jgi:hypothetical protein
MVTNHGLRRALSAADLEAAHAAGQPIPPNKRSRNRGHNNDLCNQPAVKTIPPEWHLLFRVVGGTKCQFHIMSGCSKSTRRLLAI